MNSFSLVTWNVNSIRIRMDLVAVLVKNYKPDVICLQEVKAKEEDFPISDIHMLGYPYVAFYGMPGYNGVAIISKIPLHNEQKCDWVGKKDARHIKVSVLDDIEINNIYIPAGGDVPDPIINLSFAHKLCFMDDISEWFEQNKETLQSQKILLCGDFNVAPSENDVWGHKQLLKTVSHTPIETGRLNRLFASLDFVDAVRVFTPEPEKIFSWWSYRNPNWKTNNKGRRLDHIWVSQPLKNRLISTRILTEFRAFDRPSDHVPIMVEISL